MMVERSRRPAILVGVPVYHGWDFVAETLESIRGQELRDIRVLISVEGGDERSYAACRPYADDPRFELVQQPRRLGWPGNFNWLLRQLREDFFCYWQQDDLCEPGYLRILLDHARRHPEAVGVYSDIQHFGAKNSRVVYNSITGFALQRVLDQIERNLAVPLRGLIRRDAIAAAGPKPPGPKQENVWLARIARQGELHRVPEPLYLRRIWPGSLSKQWYNFSPERARSTTLAWALGMLDVALPLTEKSDRTWLLATIVDRIAIPRDGRRYYFDPQPLRDVERRRLVDDFLRRACLDHDACPFTEIVARSDARALLADRTGQSDRPAEALMALVVLDDLPFYASGWRRGRLWRRIRRSLRRPDADPATAAGTEVSAT